MPCLQTGPDLYEFAEPLAWDVVVSNTGEALLVLGRVAGLAKTSCARCLSAFEVPLEGEIEGYYLLSDEAGSPEGMDFDEFEVLPKDGIIDLLPLMKAALLLELPLVALCDPDCKGLCPVCGLDRNTGECTCAHDPSPGEPDPPASPFSVLKDMRFTGE
ncbi:MAG: DUF177 domain-containing protein [Eggerthellaceae bacterium]|nr:DUF177 domain-containing protein [Eggerthellaceae bacterium]